MRSLLARILSIISIYLSRKSEVTIARDHRSVGRLFFWRIGKLAPGQHRGGLRDILLLVDPVDRLPMFRRRS